MPEGDTLHRTATRLRPALVGQEVVRFDARRLAGDRPRRGDQIESVEARGKHLLVDFSSGWVLQTHLRMTGSWHLYRTGSRWQKPGHLARVVLGVDGWEAVCFSAPTVRVYHRRTPGPGPVDHLGPDLCDPEADIGAATVRMASIGHVDDPIADVLLDQRIAAGVGNVYKSEVCWACRIAPSTPLAAVGPDLRRTLVETAAHLLRANLEGGPRVTVPGGLAVYGRAGRPCRRCGAAIRSARLGRHRRTTYWCPTCQPPTTGRT